MSVFTDERTRCPLRRDAAKCIVRQNWDPMPNDCKPCEWRGRKGAEDTKPAPDDTKPSKCDTKSPLKAPPVWNSETARFEENPPSAPREPNQPKKEEGMESKKERLLALITRLGPCKGTPIMQRSITAAELKKYAPELAAEGEIKMWPWRNTAFYTLPDAKDPRPAGQEKTAAPEKMPPRKAKSQRNINPRQIDKSPAPAAAGSPPPKIGGGRTSPAEDAIAAALAVLRKRRELIDKAIQHLEEMSA